MTGPGLPFGAPPSLLDLVAAHFRAHPGQRIPAWELARIGGCGGWRTRVDECRKRFGMSIENVQERNGRRTLSYYIYTPAAPAEPTHQRPSHQVEQEVCA
jgi:hypothetical protein